MLNLQVSTIVFQMLNFVILLVVLTKFFYQPVLRVMKERQEAVDAKLRAAEDRSRQAETERQRLAIQEHEAQAKAEELLTSARSDAQKVRNQIIDEAHQEAARLLDESRRRIGEQERAALTRVEARVRDTAVTMAGSLIRQAAGPAVHQYLLDQFFREGIRASATETATLRRALVERQASITVETAYPATAETEARVRELIARNLNLPLATFTLDVRSAPELVAGLRILAGDVVLDFSLRQTLLELKNDLEVQADQEAD